MRWQGSRRSTNVQDYRGGRFGGGAGLGIGGTLIALVAAYFLGVDPRVILGLPNPCQSSRQPEVASGTPTDEQGQFMAAVLGDTEDTWSAIFEAHGATYSPPTLVLFTGQVRSGCGGASAAVGPVLLSRRPEGLHRPRLLRRAAIALPGAGRFRAGVRARARSRPSRADDLLGIADKVRSAQQSASKEDANAAAGEDGAAGGLLRRHLGAPRRIARGRSSKQGDVEEALQAASAVGDDTIQKRTQGRVVPDSFTHGTAEQRMSWFSRGLEQGTVAACDTFG